MKVKQQLCPFCLYIFEWLKLELAMASLVAQKLKPLPALQETWVQSLGQKDPLEEEMSTYSIFLPG